MQEFSFKPLDDGSCCVDGYMGDEKNVVIPEKWGDRPVTILFDGLFSGHTELESVQIPDTVTDMGEFLFDGCENLRHIALPSSLTSLWPYAFVRSGVEEIVLPDGVRSLAPFTFKDCKNLQRVVCGKGLKKIYAWVFQGCVSLKELLRGPETEISPQAFAAKELNT